MPLSYPIVTQPVMDAVVAEVIEEALLHSCCFGVGVDVPQGVQCSFIVRFLETAAVVAFLPEMPRPIEHPVKTHGSVPIQPVHDPGQIFWGGGFHEIVDMIRHDAEGIKFKVKLLYSSFEGVEKHLAAFMADELELAVIAPNGYVVVVSRLEVARWSGHVYQLS